MKEKIFSPITRDIEIERDLREAKRSGRILDFQFEEDKLIVYRSSVNADDIWRYFDKETPFVDRQSRSINLFMEVLEQLQQQAHGAIHPNNVRHSEGKPVLLDWVANYVRMRAVPKYPLIYDVWLWQRHVPEGWDIHMWDRLNLLRMVTLLAGGEECWNSPPSFAEVVEQCRAWAANSIPGGTADVKKEIKKTLKVLDDLLAELPVSPRDVGVLIGIKEMVNEKLSQSNNLMLRREDEKKIIRAFRSKGIDAGMFISVVLREVGGQREEEARQVANDLLKAGLYQEGGRYVRRSSCRNAERFFEGLGMEKERASEIVFEALRKSGMMDSHALEKEWHPPVLAYLNKYCKKRLYTQRQFAQMVNIMSQFDLPEEVAGRYLRHYLDNNQYSMKEAFSWA